MAKKILFLDGDLLNLRYCWPCAKDKVHAGILSEENAARLKAMALCQIAVNRTLVQFCFPVACHKLQSFASSHDFAPWALGTVMDFWRHYHNGKGDCAVRPAIIQKAQEQAVLVACDKKILAAFNTYGLELGVNDEVLLHRRVIVEKK